MVLTQIEKSGKAFKAFETLEQASNFLGHWSLHRITNPLCLTKGTEKRIEASEEGFSLVEFQTLLKKGERPPRLEFSNSNPHYAKALLNEEEDKRDCIQEAALVLIKSGWKEGHELTFSEHWKPAFNACRILLRIQKKREVALDLNAEQQSNKALALMFGRVFKSSALKPSREKAAFYRRKIEALPENRKTKSTKKNLRGTLASLLKLARGAGWMDCPAFLNEEGKMKNPKAIEWQIGDFMKKLA